MKIASEQLARRFHDLYEQMAPSFGYETRSETRVFDPQSSNGQLMIAVTDVIEKELQQNIKTASAKKWQTAQNAAKAAWDRR